MKRIFDELSHEMSMLTTRRYSTSFSLGISFLSKELHQPIYAIYGFVRFADEIVDSFHDFNKSELLSDFKRQTYSAIRDEISLNPILNSFQWAVNKYEIPLDLIETFLHSMEMDLTTSTHEEKSYSTYILGSAEVVGLMCLKVFVKGDEEEYMRLKPFAMKLGAAFQKINFLRDLKDDYQELGRSYFPGIDLTKFETEEKKKIEAEIEEDFKLGLEGILQLPKSARFGVYMAYVYYFKLFEKIKQTAPKKIMNERIRISNSNKYRLFLTSYLKHNMNLI